MKDDLFKKFKILTLPGLFGSGPEHWQTIWEQKYGFQRVVQKNWDNPVFLHWEKVLYKNLEKFEKNSTVIIAHSLGCHLLAKSFPKIRDIIRGVFLVAPPDLTKVIMGKNLSGFITSVPLVFSVPGSVVYSENDPFATVECSRLFALKYGLEPVNVGLRGHINSDSNLGCWDEGIEIFQRLLRKC